ncbi:hypothetical protein K491DRAFT_706832 [Lophiostoma macrostomum CBS 122681]|uniref:RRM domain-containing protein n=1 Tax=Lophiostoma macrostomum CBS 122681 TaxID=1314788 RepID=A0A6A6SZT5_9PLEO|nr:hypothetical protein K491DRAFT_706832 [Lophiostoma macrostomum CBS 122681]
MSKLEKKVKRTPEEKAARKAAKEAKKAKKTELENGVSEAQAVKTTAVPAVTKTREKKRKRDAEEETEQVTEPKKSKKSKRSKTSTDAPPNEEADTRASTTSHSAPVAACTEQDFIPLDTDIPMGSGNVAADNKPSKKAKKSKKTKKSSDVEKAQSKGEAITEADAPLANSEADPATDAATGKKDRFIVFVGNLPYSATKDELQTHFSKIGPTDIRIMTDKNTGKPKGFAFVEFDRFDRMQTCLKKYNHSIFGDGKKGRKINVELTAGGGGNTSARIFKIQSKNEKLHNERERDREKRSELEAKQDERKKKKEQLQKSGKKAYQGSDSNEQAEENGGIHPSRLAMLQEPPQHERQDRKRVRRY